MSNQEIAPKRQCPECGWDSEGKPQEAPYGAAKGKAVPDDAVAYEYVCGNCGFEWTVHPS